MRSVIICVDDDKYILQALSGQLEEWFGDNYAIEKALSGEEGLSIIDEYMEKRKKISVVISDYIMPVMRGDQFLEQVHSRDKTIKKIMLTGYTVLDGIISAINKAGLYHFIFKPWDNKDLMLTIMEAIKSFEHDLTMTQLANSYKTMHDHYFKALNDVKQTFDTTITSLVGAFEKRSNKTVAHSLAVKHYAVSLAIAAHASKEDQYIVGCLALLHEAGKFSMSDDSLEKLNKIHGAVDYSDPMLAEMQKHTLNVVASISNNEYASLLANQYKPYDPAIPLKSRILAIADAFDNLLSVSASVKEAYGNLLKLAEGGVLDPQLVKLFVEFVTVYKE